MGSFLWNKLTIYKIFCRIIDASNYPTFYFRLDRMVGGLSHVRVVIPCLSYRYPCYERRVIEEVTFCELLIFTLVTGIVSGVMSAYIVKFLDKRHKNDRHSPKSGH